MVESTYPLVVRCAFCVGVCPDTVPDMVRVLMDEVPAGSSP